MRAKQRNKKVTKTDFDAALQQWHVTMRERLIRTGKDDRYDDKWERLILNVDQSPLRHFLTRCRYWVHCIRHISQLSFFYVTVIALLVTTF